MHQVLIKPLLTEKVTQMTEKDGQRYGFIVNINSNKIQIAKAVQDKFNVKVISVNTIKYKGKSKTQFTKKGRFSGKSSQFKKAFVKLEKGQTIELFEQV